MTMALLLLIQAVAGPPIPRELRKSAPRIAAPCPAAGADSEVVVCGRPTDQRLEPLPEQIASTPEDRLTFRLPGGGSGNVHAIQTQLPGATGRGAALTLKIPLGRKPGGVEPARPE